MNEKNKTAFLDERIVGDYNVWLCNFWLWEAKQFFFFIFNLTNEHLLCMPDIVEDLE